MNYIFQLVRHRIIASLETNRLFISLFIRFENILICIMLFIIIFLVRDIFFWCIRIQNIFIWSLWCSKMFIFFIWMILIIVNVILFLAIGSVTKCHTITCLSFSIFIATAYALFNRRWFILFSWSNIFISLKYRALIFIFNLKRCTTRRFTAIVFTFGQNRAIRRRIFLIYLF